MPEHVKKKTSKMKTLDEGRSLSEPRRSSVAAGGKGSSRCRGYKIGGAPDGENPGVCEEKEEMEMKLTKNEWLRGAGRQRKQNWMAVVLMAVVLLGVVLVQSASAQAISTTTVQGTVYLANGQPASGTLRVSWPSFSTANGQAVAAGSLTVTIGPDGFVSVNLAPNLSSTPAGLYYTAVFYLSDGTSSTQYWVVPAAAQASLAQVQSQLMPAAQAVQAVNKAYVDQAIRSLGQGVFTLSGGTMTGPLYLNGDPTQALQAADKHYVDTGVSQAMPIAGGAATGALTAKQLGAAYQVDQFAGADFGAKLQACLSAVDTTYGGTCDARNFTGTLGMGSNLTISRGNTTIELPCATIATAKQVVVAAGTRNVTLRGCALRGGTQASGALGGTVFAYSGTGAMIQVGDPTYAMDTQGFHLDDVVINTTAATSATAQGLVAYRTQEMDLESLYFLGNSNQTGMTLDGTSNYTGGTYYDIALNGFQTAVNAIGHQVSNAAVTDWMNASTFVRLHINCPTSGGSPIAGTYGINLQQGDGNTFTGGDVEGCATALHLGAGAQNNTIVGLRNENSTNQVVADTGSAYNNWITGGTMFTGKLTDSGTRNSFLDSFHRSFNGMNGDWYLSQQDATVTNHFRLGTALGNERGMLNRYQTDYGYRWTTGLSDATGGEQFYQVLDELNNVYRLSIGQYNNGQTNTNNQTVINAAGTGSVLFNGSTNAGTGGVVFASGGSSAAAVATINNAGNAQFNGTLQVGGTSTFTGSTTIKNQADAEINQNFWAGATTSQKESLTYKDWNGSSQWYLLKDASNNWALNSATGGLDSFKAYQSTNSGDTYINASNSTGVVRVNYETGAGAGFKVYGGNSGALYASFTGTTSIQFPGLAAGSGHYCLQIDNSGYVSNTGSACGSGGSTSGTINTGNLGQIAYYTTNGAAIGGVSTVPLTSGGTGAATAAGALANLGGISSTVTTQQTMAGPLSVTGTVAASAVNAGIVSGVYMVDGTIYTSVGTALTACLASSMASCTIDARSGYGSHALGTINSSKPTTILLGGFSDYTARQIVMSTGFHLEGTGPGQDSNNTTGTVITSSSSTNEALLVAPPTSASGEYVTGVVVKNLTLAPASGATTQDAIFINMTYSDPAVVNLFEFCEFDNIYFSPGFPGVTVHLRSDDSSQHPIQECSFTNVRANRASSATSQSLRIEGDVGQLQFYGGAFDAWDWSDNGTDVYIGSYNGGSWNPYSITFYGTSMQGGAVLAQFNGTQNIILHDTHHEGNPGHTNGFLFTLGGSQNRGVLFDGITLGGAGTTGTGNSYSAPCAGAPTNIGYAFNTYCSGVTSEITVTNSTLGSPTQVLLNQSTTTGQQNHFSNNLIGGTITTSFATPYYNAAATLNVSGNTNAYIVGTTTISNIAKTLMPGQALTFISGQDGVNLAAGGNLNLNGLQNLTLKKGETVTFMYDDSGGAWNLTGLGKSANLTFTGNTFFSNNGQPGVSYAEQDVEASNNCMILRDTVGGIGSWNPTKICGGSVNNSGWNGGFQVYTSPYAAQGSESWTQQAQIDGRGYSNANGIILPTTLTGTHGTSGTKVQLSDGTGTSGNYAKFGSDGSIADGGAGILEASVSGVRNGNGSSADTAATAHNLSVPANCVAASGSGTAYTCTTTPTFTRAAGDHIQFKADVANTGSATLAVNGSSAAAIKKLGGSGNLAANDLLAGHWVSATFDGTYWQLEGQLGQINATQVNGAAVAVSKTRLASDASGHIVAASNTLGCLDGFDHLPCVVYAQSNVSESTPTGSYATVWTSTYAGTYRITGYIYGTTASSTAFTVSNYVKATQSGQSSGNGYLVASAQIGTTISSGSGYSYVFPLNASTAVQTESLTASGTNTGGAWSHAIVVERLQ